MESLQTLLLQNAIIHRTYKLQYNTAVYIDFHLVKYIYENIKYTQIYQTHKYIIHTNISYTIINNYV